jgi:hexosaminidase
MMQFKKKCSLLFFVLSITFITAQESFVQVIPQPNEVIESIGFFTFKKSTKIISALETKETALLIEHFFKKKLQLSLKNKNSTKKKKNFISLSIDSSLKKEAYSLIITTNNIKITGGSKTGVFYGFQTLKQLVGNQEKANTKIPCLTIKDQPRFSWRAYMLDESRYFHGEKYVKLLLDQMAVLKMNIFHWHLTDDAGWRIEIKKYPKLTEIGSKRTDSEIGTWGSEKYSGKAHAGFYTQAQIKNIVAYAAKKHITVVPEFEMPGHSSAAIAAYPWLGTENKQIEVPVKFGRHYDNYDVTNPKVITFIKDVLIEIFELFPSKVIHIGGDEVGYKVWEKSAHVKEYMKKNNIETLADLQIKFTNDISKFIESKGRRMMGWNEIMGVNIHKGFKEKKEDKEATSSLAKNVVIHFWKGDLKLATKAAKQGYGIVNSLHSNTYLDYEYKHISLQKAYDFDPIPKGLEQQYHQNIYGLGCQMWSEWTPTNDNVSYQTFPRIAAYAEVGWTNSQNKQFSNFLIALDKMKKSWKLLGINYADIKK